MADSKPNLRKLRVTPKSKHVTCTVAATHRGGRAAAAAAAAAVLVGRLQREPLAREAWLGLGLG